MSRSRPNTENGGPGGQASSFVDRTDLGLTAIILIACGLLYWLTTGFDKVSDLFAQDVPPEFFPRLLLWIIAILALVLPFEHKFLRKKG